MENAKENLKELVKNLRICGFSHVEQSALQKIQELIKDLPAPENIDGYDDHKIKMLEGYIGDIQKLIETYSKRDMESKLRHIDLTNMPPRYKILDWRRNMKSNEIVKNIIKLSSEIDDKGYGEISGKMIKCAKNILENKVNEKEIEDIKMALNNSKLEKEAQFWSGVKGFLGGAGSKIKEMGQDIVQSGMWGKYQAEFDDVLKRMNNVISKTQQFGGTIRNPELKNKVNAWIQGLSSSVNAWNQVVDDFKNTGKQVAQQSQQPQQATQPQTPQSQVGAGWEDEAKKAGWTPPAIPSVQPEATPRVPATV